jgi:hypothetical protein
VCADPSIPPDGFGPLALKATANLTSGTYFSAVFSDHAVLQRAPEASAVYGLVVGVTASTKVTVSITDGGQTHDVDATVWGPGPVPASAYWKALLEPHEGGGSVVLTVACASCANTTTSTITNVTFGDVLFCSGQSNMWLPMMYSLTRNRTYSLLDSGAACVAACFISLLSTVTCVCVCVCV